MNSGVFIKNGAVILAILGVVFLSQQSYVKGVDKTFNFPLLKKGTGYSNVSKIGDWIKNNAYSKIGGPPAEIGANLAQRLSREVTKREALIGSAITDQKNVTAKNSIDTVKKFVAEKVLQTLGVKPEDLAPKCQPQ